MKWVIGIVVVAAIGFGVYWVYFRQKPAYAPLASNKPSTSVSINASDVLKLATASKPISVGFSPSQTGAPTMNFGPASKYLALTGKGGASHLLGK